MVANYLIILINAKDVRRLAYWAAYFRETRGERIMTEPLNFSTT